MRDKRTQQFHYHTRSFRNQQFDTNRPILPEKENNSRRKTSALSKKRERTVIPLSSEPLYTYPQTMTNDRAKNLQSAAGKSTQQEELDRSGTPFAGFMNEFQDEAPRSCFLRNPHLSDDPEYESSHNHRRKVSHQETNQDRRFPPKPTATQMNEAHSVQTSQSKLTPTNTGAKSKQGTGNQKNPANQNENTSATVLDQETLALLGNMMNLALQEAEKRHVAQTTRLINQIVGQTVQQELAIRDRPKVGARQTLNNEPVVIGRSNDNQAMNHNADYWNNLYRFPEQQPNLIRNEQPTSNDNNRGNIAQQYHSEHNQYRQPNPVNVNIDAQQGVQERREFQEFLRNDITNVNNRCEVDRHVNLEKWGLKFDPKSMTVDDFIFRVEAFQKSSRCSWIHIFENFHFLVKGKAETWLWQFRRCSPEANWLDLRAGLIRTFANLDSNSEICRQIMERRQGYQESFTDYYESIIDLNFRLNIPKTEAELVEIIRQNVNDQIARLIFNSSIGSLNELVQLCRKAEKFVSERNRKQRIGKVYEIDNQEEEYNRYQHSVQERYANPIQVNDEVEAIGSPRGNPARYRCYNCEAVGHSYVDCPEERRLFCYRCGKGGFITPKCPNCQNTGNSRRSASNPGGQQISNNNLEA